MAVALLNEIHSCGAGRNGGLYQKKRPDVLTTLTPINNMRDRYIY